MFKTSELRLQVADRSYMVVPPTTCQSCVIVCQAFARSVVRPVTSCPDWLYDQSAMLSTISIWNHSPQLVERVKPQSHRIVRFCDRTIGCDLVSYDRSAMFAGRATSRKSLWLVEPLIVWLLDTQSRTTSGATTHDWWCDHTWLVVRPCKTCLCLLITDTFEHDRRLILLVRSRTITHDHYDQWHVLSTIWQRFLNFSIVTWLQVWCDCGNRKHENSL